LEFELTCLTVCLSVLADPNRTAKKSDYRTKYEKALDYD
jgi:hypothetical protein